jgi:hypothetical protein
MTQTERDKSLVEWLAAKVMGWERSRGEGRYAIERWYAKDGAWFPLSWNPLDSWADAGMLITTLQETASIDSKAYYLLHTIGRSLLLKDGNLMMMHLMPRAICEAIARATGWEEVK